MFKKQNLYKFLILLPIIDLITSVTTRIFNTSLSIGILISLYF